MSRMQGAERMFGYQRVEAVEQKVRVELALQRHVAGLQGAFFQSAGAAVGGKQVFVEAVADRLADDDQFRKPGDEQQAYARIDHGEGLGHSQQQLDRHQQQVVERQQKQPRKHEEKRHLPAAVEKRGVAAPHPLQGVAHAQSYAVEQQHAGLPTDRGCRFLPKCDSR